METQQKKYNYRWMQKKDLKHFSNSKEIINLIKQPENTACVVECSNELLGLVIYINLREKIYIKQVSFMSFDALDIIIEKLKFQKNKQIEIDIDEKNLDMQLHLKSKNFIATSIKQIQDNTYYSFVLKN